MRQLRYSEADFSTKLRFEVTSLCAASRSALLAYSRARRCSSSTVRSGYLLISAKYMASEPVLDGRADGCMVPPGSERCRCHEQVGCHRGRTAVHRGLTCSSWMYVRRPVRTACLPAR